MWFSFSDEQMWSQVGYRDSKSESWDPLFVKFPVKRPKTTGTNCHHPLPALVIALTNHLHLFSYPPRVRSRSLLSLQLYRPRATQLLVKTPSLSLSNSPSATINPSPLAPSVFKLQNLRDPKRHDDVSDNGVFLFSGWSDKEDEEYEAGGGDVLPVRRRSQRRRYENRHQILSRPVLLEVLESHRLHFLRCCSSFLQMNYNYLAS